MLSFLINVALTDYSAFRTNDLNSYLPGKHLFPHGRTKEALWIKILQMCSKFPATCVH